MEIKRNHVAVAYDDKGKCEFVAKVKVINDRELNRLINEQEQHKSRELEKENELNKKVASHEENIGLLEKVLFCVQAKSVYDNFVDRGLLDNDDTFQQMWYDYYFNNGELDLENAPQEYHIILGKLVSEYEKGN